MVSDGVDITEKLQRHVDYGYLLHGTSRGLVGKWLIPPIWATPCPTLALGFATNKCSCPSDGVVCVVPRYGFSRLYEDEYVSTAPVEILHTVPVTRADWEYLADSIRRDLTGRAREILQEAIEPRPEMDMARFHAALAALPSRRISRN